MSRVELPSIEILLAVIEDDPELVEEQRREAELVAALVDAGAGVPPRSPLHGARPSPPRPTWGEYWAVTRRVAVGPSALADFGSASTIPLGSGRALHIDGPCTRLRHGSLTGWRRPGRIATGTLRRRTRVDIDLLPWSEQDGLVRLVPRSSRRFRWRSRRRRRYFDVAHEAGNMLRDSIAGRRSSR